MRKGQTYYHSKHLHITVIANQIHGIHYTYNIITVYMIAFNFIFDNFSTLYIYVGNQGRCRNATGIDLKSSDR